MGDAVYRGDGMEWDVSVLSLAKESTGRSHVVGVAQRVFMYAAAAWCAVACGRRIVRHHVLVVVPPLLPGAGSPRPEPESGIYGMVIRYGLIVRNELFLPCRERFGCSALLDHLCVYFLVECNRNVTTTAVS